MILLSLACSPDVVLEADSTRPGTEGRPGPLEVVLSHRSTVARVEERLRYDHLAAPDVSNQAPTVVFAHGGLVDRERYRWFGIHLASRGYRVVAPAHDADLAILDPSNLRWVLDDLDRREEVGPRAASGHSLGGVIASWAWEDDPRMEGVALLASFPAGEEPIEVEGPVLSISGSTDALATPAEVREGAARYLAAQTAFVEGMNHFAWTDDVTSADQERDGVLGRDLGEVRQDAMRVIDTWLDATLMDDPEALDRLAEPFAGVTP